jgi:hypothetical protein
VAVADARRNAGVRRLMGLLDGCAKSNAIGDFALFSVKVATMLP